MTINEIQNGQVCEKLISKFSVWSLETLERLHDDCFTFELPADEVHTDMMKHCYGELSGTFGEKQRGVDTRRRCCLQSM